MSYITLDFRPFLNLTNEQFYQLCQSNPNAKLERNVTGEIIVMPPTGGVTGNRNFDILGQLWFWVSQNRDLGLGFDSSTEFNLPSGGDRSPDAAWVRMERWDSLTEEEQERFPPICPDFVIELRSKTDNFKQLQAKMQEYIGSGLRLGWLIDRKQKIVEVYRPGVEVEVLESPATVSGENVLPGFVLDLKGIFF